MNKFTFWAVAGVAAFALLVAGFVVLSGHGDHHEPTPVTRVTRPRQAARGCYAIAAALPKVKSDIPLADLGRDRLNDSTKNGGSVCTWSSQAHHTVQVLFLYENVAGSVEQAGRTFGSVKADVADHDTGSTGDRAGITNFEVTGAVTGLSGVGDEGIAAPDRGRVLSRESRSPDGPYFEPSGTYTVVRTGSITLQLGFSGGRYSGTGGASGEAIDITGFTYAATSSVVEQLLGAVVAADSGN
ncbi:hypothetical protein [Actinomadura napierensis]|uniref:DUF3558 domain-containing protein n=1 Tax=Actinomadura napierensis TaxID=267854 RepID=A0ABP5LTY6_9ACTN